jgi:hypothetical protein
LNLVVFCGKLVDTDKRWLHFYLENQAALAGKVRPRRVEPVKSAH